MCAPLSQIISYFRERGIHCQLTFDLEHLNGKEHSYSNLSKVQTTFFSEIQLLSSEHILKSLLVYQYIHMNLIQVMPPHFQGNTTTAN